MNSHPIPTTMHDTIHVLRGDMVDGGLKAPALLKYLPNLNHTHFAYVGSVYGSGAWAVATACAALGYECTLFISKSEHTPPWLSKIKETGATIQWVDPLPVSKIHQMVTTDYPHLYNLPLGFDTPEFINDMADVLRSSVPQETSEIWLSAMSGVMARAACIAVPNIPIHAVLTAKHAGDIGHAIPHSAPEKFHRPATVEPPYPACPYSCAKVWGFAEKEARPNAVIINVGYAL